MVIGYLKPALNKEEAFKVAFTNLFSVEGDTESFNQYGLALQNTIREFLRTGNIDSLTKNKNLKALVNERFRQKVVGHICETEELNGLIEGEIEIYRTSMSKSGAWGGELEMKAMSEMLGIRITFLDLDKKDVSFGDERLQNLYVKHVAHSDSAGVGVHYNLMLDCCREEVTSSDEALARALSLSQAVVPRGFGNGGGGASKDHQEMSGGIGSKTLVRSKTVGDGACAFHAVFGVLVNGMYFAKDAVIKRNQLAARIKLAESGTELARLRNEGIKDLVMRGSNISGLESLQNAYQEQQVSPDKIEVLWSEFESTLRIYPRIVEYIETHASLDAKHITLRQKFDAINSIEKELRELILSIPELNEAWERFNRLSTEDFNWETAISQNHVNAYAVYIETPTQYLLPLELQMIAYAFNICLHFYTTDASRNLIGPEIYNLEGIDKVSVSFNGRDHYERVVESAPAVRSEGSISGNRDAVVKGSLSFKEKKELAVQHFKATINELESKIDFLVEPEVTEIKKFRKKAIENLNVLNRLPEEAKTECDKLSSDLDHWYLMLVMRYRNFAAIQNLIKLS